jgi:hypothetical protein
MKINWLKTLLHPPCSYKHEAVAAIIIIIIVIIIIGEEREVLHQSGLL